MQQSAAVLSLVLGDSSVWKRLDGECISTVDGRWSYDWDAENRLRSMETIAAVYGPGVGVPREKIEFVYDDRGRRVEKTVYHRKVDDSGWDQDAKVGYLFDGWNMIRELDLSGSSPTTLRNYYWGLDLSGTLTGAGGVGGLVGADLPEPVFFNYDGNGNVRQVIKADTGEFVAEYEYDAFGNTYAASDNTVDVPFRFSTKYAETDAATGGRDLGLVYYGYRFYSPSMGRWLSRDPAEELAGIDLYLPVNNDIVNRADVLGLYEMIHDDEAEEDRIFVERCEIVIVWGHIDIRRRRLRLVTPYRYSAAGAVVCYPGKVNRRIGFPLQGVALHDAPVTFSHDHPNAPTLGTDGVQEGGGAIETDRQIGVERDGQRLVATLRESARKLADELKKCGHCSTVTIREVQRGGLGPTPNPDTTL